MSLSQQQAKLEAAQFEADRLAKVVAARSGECKQVEQLIVNASANISVSNMTILQHMGAFKVEIMHVVDLMSDALNNLRELLVPFNFVARKQVDDVKPARLLPSVFDLFRVSESTASSQALRLPVTSAHTRDISSDIARDQRRLYGVTGGEGERKLKTGHDGEL